jgi:hypothetical protein
VKILKVEVIVGGNERTCCNRICLLQIAVVGHTKYQIKNSFEKQNILRVIELKLVSVS